MNAGLLVEVWCKGFLWDRFLGYYFIPLSEVSYMNEVTSNKTFETSALKQEQRVSSDNNSNTQPLGDTRTVHSTRYIHIFRQKHRFSIVRACAQLLSPKRNLFGRYGIAPDVLSRSQDLWYLLEGLKIKFGQSQQIFATIFPTFYGTFAKIYDRRSQIFVHDDYLKETLKSLKTTLSYVLCLKTRNIGVDFSFVCSIDGSNVAIEISVEFELMHVHYPI